MVVSNLIEVTFGAGLFYISKNVLPGLVGKKKVAPVVEESVGTNVGKVSFGKAVKLWIKSYTDMSKMSARFALNRAFEERVERMLILGSGTMLLVFGSNTIDATTVIIRALGA